MLTGQQRWLSNCIGSGTPGQVPHACARWGLKAQEVARGPRPHTNDKNQECESLCTFSPLKASTLCEAGIPAFASQIRGWGAKKQAFCPE